MDIEQSSIAHPIGVVARRTGLSHDVLRVWEKRYGVVSPMRAGRRRLYSDTDIERLLLLRRVTDAGHPIGQVAKLSIEQLRTLVEQEETTAPPPRTRRARASEAVHAAPVEADAALHLTACLEAVRQMQASRLEAELSRATLQLSQVDVIEQVVVPLMREVGKQWRDGALRVAHEHLTTAVVRSFLGIIARGQNTGEAAPEIVVATPAGQRHELGALVVVASAVTQGWRATYIGPDLPAAELAAAVQLTRARALALSLTHPDDEPRLADELRQLRGLVGDDVVLVIGGSAADAYADVVSDIKAVRLGDMASLRELLGELRREEHAKPRPV